MHVLVQNVQMFVCTFTVDDENIINFSMVLHHVNSEITQHDVYTRASLPLTIVRNKKNN